MNYGKYFPNCNMILLSIKKRGSHCMILMMIEFWRVMDWSWTNACYITQEYEKGVGEFLQLEKNKKSINETYYYPCVCCLYQMYHELRDICDHQFIFGIIKSYMIWTWHGEYLRCPLYCKQKMLMKKQSFKGNGVCHRKRIF